jgi:hypothetical protein
VTAELKSDNTGDTDRDITLGAKNLHELIASARHFSRIELSLIRGLPDLLARASA